MTLRKDDGTNLSLLKPTQDYCDGMGVIGIEEESKLLTKSSLWYGLRGTKLHDDVTQKLFYSLSVGPETCYTLRRNHCDGMGVFSITKTR